MLGLFACTERKIPSFREWSIDRTGGQTMLYLICTTMSRVEHARYEVPYAQELETCIWGPDNSRLCATGINVICAAGKNINRRFRIKISASYIVSTEGDVRRVTALAVEAIEICLYTVFYIRGIQALQGEMLLSPSCKISYFSLPVVHYNRYTCIFLR